MHYFSRQEDNMVGKKRRRYQWMLTLAMGLISLIMIIPLVLLVMASLTSNNEIISMAIPSGQSSSAWKHINIYGMKRLRFSAPMELRLW